MSPSPGLALDGFVIERGFLAEDQVTTLRDALERATERLVAPNPLSLGAMRFKSNIFYDDPDVRDFVCSPSVVDLLATHVGANMWVRWDQAVWKDPGAPEFPWHQDNGTRGSPTNTSSCGLH